MLCYTLQASKCRLIIGSSYFNLIQVLVFHFSYKIEVWKRGVKSCGNKELLERQTTDRCICVLIISACLQILFSNSQPASEPSDKFQAVKSRKGGAYIPVVRLVSLDICFDCLFCSLICYNLLNLSYTTSNFHMVATLLFVDLHFQCYNSCMSMVYSINTVSYILFCLFYVSQLSSKITVRCFLVVFFLVGVHLGVQSCYIKQ